MKQALHKAQSGLAVLANELERGYMNRIDAHLTVTYDTVTSELITSDAVFCDAHIKVSISDMPECFLDISDSER